jgi:type IV pilus assembly protein PilY1
MKPATYPATMLETDLYDATANLIQDGTPTEQAQQDVLLAAAPGWFIDLEGKEKGFSKALVYDHIILFTTYTGERGASTDSCKVINTQGSSYLYALNMQDGSAVRDFDNSGVINRTDRKVLLKIPGMPPGPDLVFPDPGNNRLSGDVIGMVGLEEVIDWVEHFHPVYWEEVIND